MSAALEYELEFESEEFFRALPPAALRTVGTQAARAALQAGMRTLGQAESEWETEWETAPGPERAVNPIRRVYPDAMMEHFAHAAAEAESEAEAEAFIGALIPMAARLIPRVAPMVMRAAPGLVRAVSGAVRTLRQNPTTRPLVQAVPQILRRTVRDIDRASRGGRRNVSPQQAVRMLTRETQQVLCNPRQARQAVRRGQAADRHYHRVAAANPRRLAQ